MTKEEKQNFESYENQKYMKIILNFIKESDENPYFKGINLNYWNELVRTYNYAQEKNFDIDSVKNLIIKIIKFEQLVITEINPKNLLFSKDFNNLIKIFLIKYEKKSTNILSEFLNNYPQFYEIYIKFYINFNNIKITKKLIN